MAANASFLKEAARELSSLGWMGGTWLRMFQAEETAQAEALRLGRVLGIQKRPEAGRSRARRTWGLKEDGDISRTWNHK